MFIMGCHKNRAKRIKKDLTDFSIELKEEMWAESSLRDNKISVHTYITVTEMKQSQNPNPEHMARW